MNKTYITPTTRQFAVGTMRCMMSGSTFDLNVSNDEFSGEGRVKGWTDIWDSEGEKE